MWRQWISDGADCLSASLLFSLQKFKQDLGTLVATATRVVDRNDEKRLRIEAINVKLELGQTAADIERQELVLDQFEAFCTVSMSVREGIAINEQVQDGAGVLIKG